MKTIESLQKEIDELKKELEQFRSDKESVRVSHKEQADYHESQVRFRTVFESSKLGNKIIGKDLRILQVNPALVALLGYDAKEDIVGTYILDYTPKEYQKEWKILQTKLWEMSLPSFSVETCLRKRDGSIIWCSVTSILFQDNGETMGYTIIEDVSEQRNLRKYRDDFISIASHELKTPLTSLQAVLQFMNRIIEKETEITEKLRHLARNAEVYSLKLSNLIGDLINATKIERGMLSLKKERFSFFDLLDSCCAHIRMQGIYQLVYEGDPSIEVEADKGKIDQVVANFVNNAVKYAPNSMIIRIIVSLSGGSVKLQVIDRGNGIPADKLPFIFDSYYQVNSSGHNESGMGLGLYISSEIIKQHGGEIGVNSVVGEGSEFWFTLPHSSLHY